MSVNGRDYTFSWATSEQLHGCTKLDRDRTEFRLFRARSIESNDLVSSLEQTQQ